MGHDESSGGADAQEQDSTGLQRVVWFRQMLHRWQQSSSCTGSATATATETRSSLAIDDGDGASPDDDATTDRNNDDDDTPSAAENSSSSRNLPRVLVVVEERRQEHPCTCECESPMTPVSPDAPAAPADVPRGCCPVYVGAELERERRRFVVPTAYLGMPVFRRLLEKAEEEFEFHYHGGALTIPCDTEAFKYILVVMERHRQGLVDDDGNEKHAEQGASSLPSQAAR